jgi:hypothetical protein
MKIHPQGAEMFHADRWTDRHDEANSRFHNFANMHNKLEHATSSKYEKVLSFTYFIKNY